MSFERILTKGQEADLINQIEKDVDSYPDADLYGVTAKEIRMILRHLRAAQADAEASSAMATALHCRLGKIEHDAAQKGFVHYMVRNTEQVTRTA